MSAARASSQLRVVHLDDHAAHEELPARHLEAERPGLRVFVAEGLDDAISLVEDEEADCLVAGVDGLPADSAETVCSRARAAVSDLPIVFFDACDPETVLEQLDAETSFVPRSTTADAGSYGLLANRIESLVPRRRETSVFDPLAEELEALLDASAVPACVFRAGAVTYRNDAFADAFGVGTTPIREDRVFDAIVEGEGECRSLCTPPADGTASVAIEYPDGDQHRVHVTAASDGGAVLALWADASGGIDPGRPSREEAMFRSLLEEIPISVYFKDQQSRHVRVSDALIDMSAEEYLVNGEGKRHPTSEDVVGKTDFDLYHGDHASLTVEDDRQVMETERPIELKEEFTRSDTGEDIWVLTCKAPWYDTDGEVGGVAGVTVDVTEQKLNQRQESPLDGRLDQFEQVLTTTFRDELQAAIETVEHATESEASSGTVEGGAVASEPDASGTVEPDVPEPEATDAETTEPAAVEPDAAAPEVPESAGVDRHATDGQPDAADAPPADAALASVADRLDVLEGLLADTMTLARYTRTPTQRTAIDLREFLVTVWEDLDPELAELVVEETPVLFADDEQLHCLLRNLFEVAVAHGGAGVTVEVGGLEEGFYLERDGPPLTPQERDALMEGRVDLAVESLGLAMTIVVGIADANGWNATVSSGGRRFEFTDVELR